MKCVITSVSLYICMFVNEGLNMRISEVKGQWRSRFSDRLFPIKINCVLTIGYNSFHALVRSQSVVIVLKIDLSLICHLSNGTATGRKMEGLSS